MSPALGEALTAGRARLAAAGVDAPDLDARLLLAHAAAIDGDALWSLRDAPLAADSATRYEHLLEQRERRVPLAYLTAWREFWSLAIGVDPRVLVPRPETETLVETALELLGPEGNVAEVGTGSGAVVIALARELPETRFWATDLSEAALQVARANAESHGLAGRIRFAGGDLLEPLAGCAGILDAVISNPPYIPTGDIEQLEPEVREHEPRTALDGGPDGLRLLERLIAGAPRLLRTGGWLLSEIGAGQASAAIELARRTGSYDRIETRRDLSGTERVLAARRA